MKDVRQLCKWQERQEKNRKIKESKKYLDIPISGVFIEILSIDFNTFEWLFLRENSYYFEGGTFFEVLKIIIDPLEKKISNDKLTTLVYYKHKKTLRIFIRGIKISEDIKVRGYLKYNSSMSRPKVIKINKIREVSIRNENPDYTEIYDCIYKGNTRLIMGIKKLNIP